MDPSWPHAFSERLNAGIKIFHVLQSKKRLKNLDDTVTISVRNATMKSQAQKTHSVAQAGQKEAPKGHFFCSSGQMLGQNIKGLPP